jgi:hypothetical protein
MHSLRCVCGVPGACGAPHARPANTLRRRGHTRAPPHNTTPHAATTPGSPGAAEEPEEWQALADAYVQAGRAPAAVALVQAKLQSLGKQHPR